MSTHLKLELRQKQSQVLAPHLQQSLQILHVSNLDLTAYLTELAESNGFLTVEPPELDTPVFQSPQTKGSEEWGSDIPISETLKGHLHQQVGCLNLGGTESRIAAVLIDALTPEGYLRIPLATLAVELRVRVHELNTCLQKLQTLDPPGVFARDLMECLRIQLQDKGEWNEDYDKIFAHGDCIARYDLAKLSQLTGMSPNDLTQTLRSLRQLDPHPGLRWLNRENDILRPELSVTFHEGNWIVDVLSSFLPKVSLESGFYQECLKRTTDRQEKTFIRQNFSQATMIQRAINQRQQTLLKVGVALVQTQRDFLDYGLHYLTPMTLARLARMTGFHESTMSRVIANKSIATPRGVFPLKYFFASGLKMTESADAFSSETIKQWIRSFIQTEKSGQVLSDADLVKHLEQKGVKVARRTVAKYREKLKIQTASERRKQFSFSTSLLKRNSKDHLTKSVVR